MPPAKVPTTPNVLLLMVDQMRVDAMACAGNPHIRTPGLDRLAAEGTRFARAYSPVPVCIPARHGLLTGRHCAAHGRPQLMVPNPEPLIETLPQLLGLAGYANRAIGKVHFRPVRRHFGFHRLELMEEIPDFLDEDEYLLYLRAHGYGHIREVHGIRNILYHLPQVSLIPEEHHGSTWVADRTIDFLRHHRGRPFFCFSSWIAPHPPWNPPEPFASMYDSDELPLPIGWDRDPATLPPLLRRHRTYADVKDASPELLRRIKALYYGSISLIDKGVGRILDALDETGLADNTLVIFTTDHGEMMGDQHGFQKSNPYEPASHIPLLLRLPGRIEAGQVNDQLVSLLDLMPTVLDLAEIEHPAAEPLPGASLLGRPGGGLAKDREQLVIELGQGAGRWLSIRDGGWRYAYYFDSGWEELYHLSADPHELHNLLLEGNSTTGQAGATQGSARQRADALLARLMAWEHRYGYASSFDEAGRFRNFAVPESKETTHNHQLPRWLDRLTPDEQAAMMPIGEALIQAVRLETAFGLEDLAQSGSLQVWQRDGGSLRGTPYAHLLGEDD